MKTELKKILFVDDDSDILLLVKYCLKSLENVEVIYTNSGEKALFLLEDFKPDLIFLDVMMPHMDGPEVLQRIRLKPNFKDTPIVFLTAKAQKNEIDSYLQMGAASIITKPFEALTLAENVLTIWNNHVLKT